MRGSVSQTSGRREGWGGGGTTQSLEDTLPEELDPPPRRKEDKGRRRTRDMKKEEKEEEDKREGRGRKRKWEGRKMGASSAELAETADNGTNTGIRASGDGGLEDGGIDGAPGAAGAAGAGTAVTATAPGGAAQAGSEGTDGFTAAGLPGQKGGKKEKQRRRRRTRREYEGEEGKGESGEEEEEKGRSTEKMCVTDGQHGNVPGRPGKRRRKDEGAAGHLGRTADLDTPPPGGRIGTEATGAGVILTSSANSRPY